MIKSNFVGTSYGGAEVAANAVATGKDAILFNPASPNLSKYGLSFDDYEANMVSYIIEGEALSETVGKILKLPGEKRFIERDTDWKTIFNRYMMLGGGGLLPSLLQIQHSFKDHGLSNFTNKE